MKSPALKVAPAFDGGPAPHRAGGLKYEQLVSEEGTLGPAPHRAGGLK